ncbi:MAG: SDR family oxidoreductase [Acidimicrobiales bacterium]
MDLGIAGKRAAVAAASAGLGLGTARALAEAGVKVAICGRNAEKVEKAAAGIDGDVIPMVADLSTPAAATEWVAAAAQQLGGAVDILVCNNGGPTPGNFKTTPLDAFPAALDLSLNTTVAMCYAAIPAMQAQRWGRVLAITSVSVRQPIPYLILSNTARAGVTGFLKTVALEVAGDGVTVNTIQPGSHLTDRLGNLTSEALDNLKKQTPTGTIGDPEDFGKIAAFLCSEPAKFITGASLSVDGGAYKALQ